MGDVNNQGDLLQRRGKSSDLVVMIHGFRGSPASFEDVRTALGGVADLSDADFFAPQMPFSISSSVRPARVVAQIIKKIDQLWQESQERDSPYERIYLLGHSMGGVFVRKVYVSAAGSHPDAPLEADFIRAFESLGADPPTFERPWASKVERVILIAALNRGWSISQHMGYMTMILWFVGSVIGRVRTVLTKDRRPLVFALKRGSPFIAQLRIQWIRMRQRAAAPEGFFAGGAVTVQLLGSVDDIVSPLDSIDAVAGSDFYYIDVPYSSHPTIMQMAGEGVAKERRECLIQAMTAAPEVLNASTVPPVDESFHVRNKVDDVVFVMHGIRDNGYWTQKIARKVIRRGRDQSRNVVAETSSYGYFPMLPFIWPWTRRRKVEWLMDQYAEAVARYPKAKFAYMGHSNGTYLLASSLKDYSVVRFTYVVFVGSVVVTDFDWNSYIEQGRVLRVLNYTASTDRVVAYFPKLFQRPRIQQLGSAGHDGFTQAGDPGVLELGPIRGGHSAARREREWDAIAKFLLNGADVGTDSAAKKRSGVVAFFSWVPLVVWVLILAAIVGVFVLFFLIVDSTGWRITFTIVYLFVLWKILTRV